MTVKQLWVQNEAYTARDDRLMVAGMLPPGATGPLGSVTGIRRVELAGPDFLLSVVSGNAQQFTIGPGVAYIPWAGSVYMLTNDATLTLTFDVADATRDRIDLVVAQVYDSEAGGPNQSPAIRVINGTPSANAVEPAVPAGALPLYTLRYNAGASSAIPFDRRGTGTSSDVAVSAYASTLTAADQNVGVYIPIDVINFNRGGWVLSNNGLICPVSGFYSISAFIASANTVNNGGVVGHFQVTINRGAGVRLASNAHYSAGIWVNTSCATHAGLAQGDLLRMSYSHTCATTVYVDPGAGVGGNSSLHAHLVSKM